MSTAIGIPTAQAVDMLPTRRKEQNACLASLSSAALALLKPYLINHSAATGMPLWAGEQATTQVYFPVSGLVSVSAPMRDGNRIEVANVGREGAACASFEPRQANVMSVGLVTIGGTFRAIAIERLLAAAEQNTEIRDLVDRCRMWLLIQAQQIAACNTVHGAEKRFARWLLTCSEKLDSVDVAATQEQIAALLGIRRTTLSLIAHTLFAQGVIEYRRGRIRIVSPDKLKTIACECCDRLGRPHWPSTGGAWRARWPRPDRDGRVDLIETAMSPELPDW